MIFSVSLFNFLFFQSKHSCCHPYIPWSLNRPVDMVINYSTTCHSYLNSKYHLLASFLIETMLEHNGIYHFFCKWKESLMNRIHLDEYFFPSSFFITTIGSNHQTKYIFLSDPFAGKCLNVRAINKMSSFSSFFFLIALLFSLFQFLDYERIKTLVFESVSPVQGCKNQGEVQLIRFLYFFLSFSLSLLFLPWRASLALTLPFSLIHLPPFTDLMIPLFQTFLFFDDFLVTL